jgi:hypothetical protein
LLIENRFPCGFDSELKGSTPPENRNGIAVWQIDESGIQSGVDHQSEGRPGDGKYPRLHYLVALLQADSSYDLEKGLNRGDEDDMFRTSSEHPNVAYKIGPDGVVRNNGQTNRYPNTNSYATGIERNTGINIEFGPPGSDMWMKVDLDGSKPQQRNKDTAGKRPAKCSNSSAVCFTLGGKVYDKECKFVRKKDDRTCNLVDHKTGKLVRDICIRACRNTKRL